MSLILSQQYFNSQNINRGSRFCAAEWVVSICGSERFVQGIGRWIATVGSEIRAGLEKTDSKGRQYRA